MGDGLGDSLSKKRLPMLLPKEMTHADIQNFITNPFLLTQKERKKYIK